MEQFSQTFKRQLNIQLPQGKSAFLWGPRKVGKSFWLKNHLDNAILIDLLKSEVFADYASRPWLLRERFNQNDKIIIDEIQKLPNLLDEVHWLIENRGISFILTGSSARKLKRAKSNLLGGRAWRYVMTPLCYPEIENLDIEHALFSGLIPSHYASNSPLQELRAYIADYLKEEIAAEAVVQNIPAFSEFLRITALLAGEQINYSNIARESGVSTKIIRNYFQILEDTLLGTRLQPWRRVLNSRKLVESEKFYLFDVGVSNYLARRQPAHGTPEFGKSFEHYIFMELQAYKAYRNPECEIRYFRTSTGLEVDFIIDNMAVGVEVKSSKRIDIQDTKTLAILQKEFNLKRAIIISFEDTPRVLDNGVESLPWRDFLNKLWSNEIIDLGY